MTKQTSNPIEYHADLVIVGGGAAGLMAGILAKDKAPDLDVLILEKANTKRSGCLAMGLNAVNLYLTDEDVDHYVNYVKDDMYGIIREDLVRSIGERVNRFVPMLEQMGIPFPRTENGDYIRRSRRSIVMRGERLKPLLSKCAEEKNVRIVNHINVVDILQNNAGEAAGVTGYDVHNGACIVTHARGVLIATGGASGIYRPSNPGTARKKTWYCPYNAGSGMAMGLRAGAEMTSFESRYIALRTKDLIAPTGTLALGTNVKQINARGEEYLQQVAALLGRRLTTCERLFYEREENRNGRGPCMMDLSSFSQAQYEEMICNYLDMSPGLVLQLLEDINTPRKRIEVSASEPYINGGHGMAGFWVDINRQTTVPNLYAAGDTVGGAPKKYLTGCFAEAEMAIEHFISNMPTPDRAPLPDVTNTLAPLKQEDGLHYTQIEERLQKIMDEYAGGYSVNYATNREKLNLANDMLQKLSEKASWIQADNYHNLMRVHEVKDRILLAQVLVKHMEARKETRWPVYQSRLDYPVKNDVEYHLFINSKLEQGQIQVFTKPLHNPCR